MASPKPTLRAASAPWFIFTLLVAILFFVFLDGPGSRNAPSPQQRFSSRDLVGLETNDFDLPYNLSQLRHRANDDDITTCKKGTKCKTEACCGSFQGTDEGVCGFGPDFCGDDCDSQCDAKAECGAYAAVAGEYSPFPHLSLLLSKEESIRDLTCVARRDDMPAQCLLQSIWILWQHGGVLRR